MFYFAYGSNLSTKYMRQSCPSAAFVIRADLPNYRVAFPYYSQSMQGGISSIVEAPGELVRGVIYRVSAEEMMVMDALESVSDEIYRREAFLVLGEDRSWRTADLYRLVKPGGPYTPAKRYLDLMIAGAKQHGLAADYVETLVSLRRSLDPDIEHG